MARERMNNTPEWFDGKKINEVSFCEDFLSSHPMKCIQGRFFTVDGLVDDEESLRMEIYDRIKDYACCGIAKKATQLLDALRLACYSPPLPASLGATTYTTYTYYSKMGATTCGRFVPFREVKGASPFAPAFQKSITESLAKPFNGKVEQLKRACVALKGEPISHSDAGYIIHAFDFMPVMLVFWDGDEEFEAQANLLFDADITDFIHEETVCCIAGNLMQRLKEIAEVHA